MRRRPLRSSVISAAPTNTVIDRRREESWTSCDSHASRNTSIGVHDSTSPAAARYPRSAHVATSSPIITVMGIWRTRRHTATFS